MVKELVEHLVKEIVEKPESVLVQEHTKGDMNVIEITVDPQDRGKVIGREGQTIKALRILIGAIFVSDKKLSIDLVQL
ncbi:MAG TPA: KH domain-containing protein [Patescibacteria group bacterium]|jgi:hypothetical protein|nr:KH domain-containing protein [Patescibacteria group bacterium]